MLPGLWEVYFGVHISGKSGWLELYSKRDHRWVLSLLSVSCVSLALVSFLNHFILETIIEGIEEREKKKNTLL